MKLALANGRTDLTTAGDQSDFGKSEFLYITYYMYTAPVYKTAVLLSSPSFLAPRYDRLHPHPCHHSGSLFFEGTFSTIFSGRFGIRAEGEVAHRRVPSRANNQLIIGTDAAPFSILTIFSILAVLPQLNVCCRSFKSVIYPLSLSFGSLAIMQHGPEGEERATNPLC